MTIRKVSFTSRKSAETLPGDPATAVISITDPGQPEAHLAPTFRHVLRLAFFDAVPADEFLPAPIPGLFDHRMARQVSDFLTDLQARPADMSLLVHCEFGVSRSAAVALFAEAMSGAPLEARSFAYEANHWVIHRLQLLHPGVNIDIPSAQAANERRHAERV